MWLTQLAYALKTDARRAQAEQPDGSFDGEEKLSDEELAAFLDAQPPLPSPPPAGDWINELPFHDDYGPEYPPEGAN